MTPTCSLPQRESLDVGGASCWPCVRGWCPLIQQAIIFSLNTPAMLSCPTPPFTMCTREIYKMCTLKPILHVRKLSPEMLTTLISWHFLVRLKVSWFSSLPFSIRVFSDELVLCIRWPKYWSFNFSISPSKEYSAFINKKYYDSTTWFIKLVIVSPKGTSLRTCHRAWKLVLSMRPWYWDFWKHQRGQKKQALRVVTRDKHQTPFHNLSRFSLALFWNKCRVISLHR